MQSIDRDHSALADDFIVNQIIPENKIDIRSILLACKWEILHGGIYLTNRFIQKRTQCIIPSLKTVIRIWYNDGHIFYKRGEARTLKIPCVLEDEIPDETIDIICALIEHKKLNTIF